MLTECPEFSQNDDNRRLTLYFFNDQDKIQFDGINVGEKGEDEAEAELREDFLRKRVLFRVVESCLEMPVGIEQEEQKRQKRTRRKETAKKGTRRNETTKTVASRDGKALGATKGTDRGQFCGICSQRIIMDKQGSAKCKQSNATLLRKNQKPGNDGESVSSSFCIMPTKSLVLPRHLHCASCGKVFHTLCVEIQGGTPPRTCPGCRTTVDWDLSSAASSSSFPDTSTGSTGFNVSAGPNSEPHGSQDTTVKAGDNMVSLVSRERDNTGLSDGWDGADAAWGAEEYSAAWPSRDAGRCTVASLPGPRGSASEQDRPSNATQASLPTPVVVVVIDDDEAYGVEKHDELNDNEPRDHARMNDESIPIGKEYGTSQTVPPASTRSVAQHGLPDQVRNGVGSQDDGSLSSSGAPSYSSASSILLLPSNGEESIGSNGSVDSSPLGPRLPPEKNGRIERSIDTTLPVPRTPSPPRDSNRQRSLPMDIVDLCTP